MTPEQVKEQILLAFTAKADADILGIIADFGQAQFQRGAESMRRRAASVAHYSILAFEESGGSPEKCADECFADIMALSLLGDLSKAEVEMSGEVCPFCGKDWEEHYKFGG